ncbi:hypothetical protein AN958_01021 [Leucoagaricus sp. SymC.cos]|nr:hypothetical protein AN958_01021 [Leucoagaricus sp. SymC.cos]
METASTTPYSNRSDDDDNIECVREVLQQLEMKLKRTVDEMDKLEGRLATLEEQKRLLKRHIDIRDSIHVPINKLPPHILREIFTFCLPYGRNPVMSNKEAPVLLGQVCRGWRQVAHNTPQLWTAIHISLSSSPQTAFWPSAVRKHEATRLRAISSWLLRSQDLPLSISLISNDSSLSTSPSLAEKLAAPYLQLLSFFSYRWRLVYVSIRGIDWIRHFFSRYKRQHIPLLEKLHIDGSRCNVGKFTGARVTKALSEESSFLHCPKLSWLSLNLLGELIVEVPVQWSQLTMLSLNGACGCPLFKIMETLASCSNLEFLSTCFDIASTGADLALEQTVTLPYLISLCIIDHCTSYDSARFLNHLRAPRVRSFCYDRHPPAPWLSHIVTRESLSKRLLKAFGVFVNRIVESSIEELSIQYDWLADGDLNSFLSLLPHLKRLALRGNGRAFNGTTTTNNSAFMVVKPLVFEDTLLRSLLTVPERRDIVVITRDVSDLEETSDDSSDENEGSDAGGDGVSGVSHPIGITRVIQGDGEDEVWKETYNFFCPDLEVLRCTNVTFSGQSILKFLRSRASLHKRFGISRIRAIDIAFDHGHPEPSESVLDEIRDLGQESGISVFLHFAEAEQVGTPPPPPYSIYNGLYSVGFNMSDRVVFSGVF